MADAVILPTERGEDGFYNVERMLKRVLAGPSNAVLLCGTCMDARGLGDNELVEGARRSTMRELAQATITAWVF